MNILNPLPVPWQMAATSGWIELTSPEHGPHTVRIGASFLPDIEGADAPGSADRSARPTEAHVVRLTFPGTCWLRRSAPTPGGDPIRESDYRMPDVWDGFSGTDDIDESFRHFYALWQETGLCPDPSVYIVGNSDWNIGPDKERLKLHHFFFYGRDSVLEILAPSFSWVSEGRRDW